MTELRTLVDLQMITRQTDAMSNVGGDSDTETDADSDTYIDFEEFQASNELSFSQVLSDSGPNTPLTSVQLDLLTMMTCDKTLIATFCKQALPVFIMSFLRRVSKTT